jgi:hypothetical protein
VTFAGIVGIILGCFGAFSGLMVLSFSTILTALLSSVPVIGIFFAALDAVVIFFGALWLGMGILGIAAGIQVLHGKSWARWTLIVLDGLGAVMGLFGISAVLPLGLSVLTCLSIWFLLNDEAKVYFEGPAGTLS